jgi:hypothetical protein
MVKGIDKESEPFSTFIDAFDHYSQVLLPKVKPSSSSSGSNLEKITASPKGLKIYEKIVFSENPENLPTISSKLAQKLLKKLKTKENSEKTFEIISKFLLISRKILLDQDKLDEKFILRLVKLLKSIQKSSDRFEILKVLAKYLTRQEDFELLWKVSKVLKEDHWEFGVSVIFSFSEGISGKTEKLQQFFKNFPQSKLTKKAINEVFRILENFSTESDTNLNEYFKVLLVLSDTLLENPKLLNQNESKLRTLLLKSLQNSSNPRNYPQKLQLLDRLTSLQATLQLYTPGLVIHLFEILNSPIFQKRSKSQRVSSVSFTYKSTLSLEEQTSEKYKEELLSWIFSILKKHFSYLKQVHPSSLPFLKIQLIHLETSLPSSLSSFLKSLIKL